MNRSIIARLFAAICLIMVMACPGWADSIVRPLIGNFVLGSQDLNQKIRLASLSDIIITAA